MLRHTLSPMRIITGLAVIAAAILIYMTLNPDLSVEPVPSSDARAPFGTMFDLHNRSIAILYDLSSTYCVNSFQAPQNEPALPNGAIHLGVASQGVTLRDLSRGDTAVLPIENVFSGTPGSEVDLVFSITFQPGWRIAQKERRYRFHGTEGQDKTWTWKQVPLGSRCG